MLTRSAARTEPDRLGDVVLWSHLVAVPEPPAPGEPLRAPTVIQNKDGALMTTLRYRGPDVAMQDVAQWRLYLEGWNRLVQRLGSGWALWADEWHEPARTYPQSPWTNPVGYFVDSIRQARFDADALYETDQFLTLTWQPPSTQRQYWFHNVFLRQEGQPPAARRRQARADHQGLLTQYVTAMQRFLDALSHLVPLARWCTPRETLTYLHRCVSWDRHTVGIPEGGQHLDLRLTNRRTVHGLTPRLGPMLLCPLGVRSWPSPGVGMTIPTTMQQLACPYRFTVRYLCLDTADAKKILSGMRDRWEMQVLPVMTHVLDAWNGTKTDWEDPTATVNEEARGHAWALKRAIQELANEDLAYGYCSPTLLLWAETPGLLASRRRAVTKLLHQQEFILEAEDENATKAWQSTLPGDVYSNVRNPLLSTRVFAFVLPHGAVWPGEPWDRHFGGPSLLTVSSNGEPFYYTLHQGEVGNTMILGPTRSGKSGLLGLIGMQALRYPGIQIFCFDRDYSLYCATLMAGGAHYNIGHAGTRGLQPLGHLARGDDELRKKHEWLQDLFTAEGLPPTLAERKAMWDALVHLATEPPRERRLSLYAKLLQVVRLKEALQPYLEGERYGLFDAAEDSFTLGAQWTTFEMGGLFDLPPHVQGLALSYLFDEMERCFTGAPVLILGDEFWQMGQHPVFRPKIAMYLKSKAKLNVSIVLSSQEVVDVRLTELWQAIQGSVRSWIYLPNKRAMDEDVRPHYAACGLPDAHIQLLALAQEHRDYLLKNDTNTRLFQCELDPLQRALVAASTPDEIAQLRALVGQPLPEPLPAAWLRRCGFGQEADLYLETLATQEPAA